MLRKQLISVALALAVLVAVVVVQFYNTRYVMGAVNCRVVAYHHGWPLVSITVIQSQHIGFRGSGLAETVEWKCQWRKTVLNGLVSCILVASAFVIPIVIRRRRLRPYQFTLADMGIGMLVLAIGLCYFRHERDILLWCGASLGDIEGSPLSPGIFGLPWFLSVPLALAGLAFIALACRLIVGLLGRLVRIVLRAASSGRSKPAE